MQDQLALEIKIGWLIKGKTRIAGHDSIDLLDQGLSAVLDADILMVSVALYSKLFLIAGHMNGLVGVDRRVLH
jgi:hypothetical protein